MPGLRKATAVVAVAATLVASFPASPVLAQPPVLPATATPTAPVDPAALIGSTIKAFPHGGEPLKLRSLISSPSIPNLRVWSQTIFAPTRH